MDFKAFIDLLVIGFELAGVLALVVARRLDARCLRAQLFPRRGSPPTGVSTVRRGSGARSCWVWNCWWPPTSSAPSPSIRRFRAWVCWG